jgi:hypothetical protein
MSLARLAEARLKKSSGVFVLGGIQGKSTCCREVGEAYV